MRTMTRGKAAIAGVMALGLALIATPAYAAVGTIGEPPVVTVENDTFSAGSWGDGVSITVDNVPEEATNVTLSSSSMGENGGGAASEPVDAIDEGDGVYTGTITADDFYGTPVANSATYAVNASYTYTDSAGDEQFVWGENVELTITEGMAVDGPAAATVGELAAGVELSFSGFEPNETATGSIEFMDPETFEWSSVGEFSATMGDAGDGTGTLTITGATAGDRFRVFVNGESGSVTHYIEATEGGEENPGDEDSPAVPEAPETPKKPERVETGA